jgi:hypothetical protein
MPLAKKPISLSFKRPPRTSALHYSPAHSVRNNKHHHRQISGLSPAYYSIVPPKADKTYSADVVAAVSAATGTTSLSMRHYELMSSIDGVKTASAFQHDF